MRTWSSTSAWCPITLPISPLARPRSRSGSSTLPWVAGVPGVSALNAEWAALGETRSRACSTCTGKSSPDAECSQRTGQFGDSPLAVILLAGIERPRLASARPPLSLTRSRDVAGQAGSRRWERDGHGQAAAGHGLRGDGGAVGGGDGADDGQAEPVAVAAAPGRCPSGGFACG